MLKSFRLRQYVFGVEKEEEEGGKKGHTECILTIIV